MTEPVNRDHNLKKKTVQHGGKRHGPGANQDRALSKLRCGALHQLYGGGAAAAEACSRHTFERRFMLVCASASMLACTCRCRHLSRQVSNWRLNLCFCV